MPKKKLKAKKKVVRKRRASVFLKLYPITITNNHGATAVHPDTQRIWVPGKDEVVWGGSADFNVDFNGPNGSPFGQSHFSGGPGRQAYSGPPVNTLPNTDYKYTAQISGATPVDPIIHTDP